MMKLIIKLAVALLGFHLSACVSVLDATSKGPIATDPTERSFGGMLDDKRLSTIIAVNLKKSDERLNQSNIKVTSYNAIVLLTGQIPDIELRKLAGKVARATHGVRIVHNELEVMPNITLAQKSRDKWLDTKIEAKLFANKEIKSQKVKVIVQNSIAYLMGVLDDAEADAVTDIVRRTSGVTKVVRALEFIDQDRQDDVLDQNQAAADEEDSRFLAAPLNKNADGEPLDNPFTFYEDETAIEDKGTDN